MSDLITAEEVLKAVWAEREACARLAEEHAARYDIVLQRRVCEAVAKAIRARSDGTL